MTEGVGKGETAGLESPLRYRHNNMSVRLGVPRRVPPYVALIPICAGVFIAADDQTVVVTVLPQIMLDMRVQVTEIDHASWTITGYLLGYLAAMPLVGRLSDIWGHRRLFIVSMAFFMLGSIGVALTPTLDLLIMVRVFQAVGAGALVPISIALTGDLFPAGSRGLPYGLVGASAEAGGVIGPLWGGLVPKYMDKLWDLFWHSLPTAWVGNFESISQPLTWRWVFWINIPLGIAVLLVLVLLVGPSPKLRAKVDYVGGGLVAVSLAALTLGLARIDLLDLLMAGYLALAIASLTLFVFRQTTVSYPLLSVSMFRGWAFSAACGTHLMVGGALIIGMVTVPLMANTVMALTPLEGGLWLMRMTAAIPVGAVLGGVACQRLDYRIPAIIGLGLVALGFLLMSQWEVDISDPTLTAHLALVGLGFGFLIAPIALTATDSVGEGNRGTAAAMITAMRMVGMTLGLAALTSWGSDRFYRLAAGIQLPLPLLGETQTQIQERALEFDVQLKSAGMTLFSEFFTIAMIVSLIALVPTALMAWHRGRGLGPGQE